MQTVGRGGEASGADENQISNAADWCSLKGGSQGLERGRDIARVTWNSGRIIMIFENMVVVVVSTVLWDMG